MKRALIIMVAALIVLFACPSTDSMAGQPGVSTPIVGSNPDGGRDLPPARVDTSDDDDGDADGVAGFASKKGLGGTQESTVFEGQLVYLKLWWNLFIWIR